MMHKCPFCGLEVSTEEYLGHYDSHSSGISNSKRLGVDSVAEWLIPFVPLDRRPYVWDLVLFDDLIRVLFERLCVVLEAPSLVLEINYRSSWRAAVDGYSGIEGKVILTINPSKTDRVLPGDLAYTFIHEIGHHKFPEKDEADINKWGLYSYEKIFGEKLSGWKVIKLV